MLTTSIVLASVLNPTPFWSGPLTLAAPDPAPAPAADPSPRAVAPLGQSEDTSAAGSVGGGWVWQLRTDLTDTPSGRFSHDRGHVLARARIPLRDDLELLLSGRYQRDNFSFENLVAPWSSVNTTHIDAGLQWQATRQWQVFGGGQARWAAEQGGSLGDGFEGGGMIGAAYAFSRELVVGGGVGVRSRIEDSLLIYPVIVLDWQISERLMLSTNLTTGWANQSGAELVYTLDDRVDVGISAVFDYQRFRLGDDTPTPGGVGTTEALPVMAFIDFDVCPTGSLRAFVGATVYGRLKSTTAAGSDVWASDHDPAPIFGVQGTIRF
ncbi:MAG: hypothetical protein QF733_04935 [Phycisphaerales bacterium]|jgi:hypothetical protein|nr:hypothetical protein [Phycisphaerales bacterium]